MDESKDVNAKIALQELERRTRLLKAVNFGRHSKSHSHILMWISMIAYLGCLCLIVFTEKASIIYSLAIFVSLSFMALSSLIDVRVDEVNKRINALVELLNISEINKDSKQK